MDKSFRKDEMMLTEKVKTFKKMMEELEKYRRKPNIVHSAQYTGDVDKLPDEIKNHKMFKTDKEGPYIETLEGNMRISKGDFIVIGIKDDMFPVKPSIFKQNYTKE
jgi:hypothetical protein